MAETTMENQWDDVKNIYSPDDQFKDNEGEYLKTSFDLPGRKDHPSYFVILSYNQYDNAILFYNDEIDILDYKPRISTEFGESMDTAKKAVESTIEHFSKSNDKSFTIDDIQEHLETQIHYNSNQVKENLKRATDILATGESQAVQNEELGDIYIDKGLTGKNGYGLLHIIENRTNEGKNDEETTAIIHLVTQAAKEGKINRNITDKDNPEKVRRVELEKNGIIALISLQKNQNEEKWVLTGFDNRNKKEEAAEAIQTVIAKYGRTPEFSYFRKQVGAAVSSLQQVSPQSNNKSSEIETAKKAGYVQGVCECVAAVGSDYALGKKLLTEMNISKKTAEKYANPETYKTLEKGIFAQMQEQKIEHQQKRGHRR